MRLIPSTWSKSASTLTIRTMPFCSIVAAWMASRTGSGDNGGGDRKLSQGRHASPGANRETETQRELPAPERRRAFPGAREHSAAGGRNQLGLFSPRAGRAERSAFSPQLDISPTIAVRPHDLSFRAAREASGNDERYCGTFPFPVAALNAC